MTDSPAQPDEYDETGATGGRRAPTGMPRWVKVFAGIGVILVVVLLVAILFGGNHGPGRHTGDVGGAALATAPDFGGASAHQQIMVARPPG